MNKKSIFLITSIWILLISLSLIMNIHSAKKEQNDITFEISRSFFNLLVLTRQWNSEHDSVYVPVDERTQPNPYLLNDNRDIIVNEDLTLTMMNPAYMTRQISELALEQENVQFRITSLYPLRVENEATEMEKSALLSFESGEMEVGQVLKDKEGDQSFFYMAPLFVKQDCLRCHTEQKYKVGDNLGGISVTLPFVVKVPLLFTIIGHILIVLGGLMGIFFLGKRLNKAYKMIKTQAMKDSLTGIPNRRDFHETIVREFKRSQRENDPLAVIMCDIDMFKLYNDNYGHVRGDQCLQKVARVIKASLNRPLDFCARYGGEEFVIVLPNISQSGVSHVAEKIRKNVEGLQLEHKSSEPLNVVTISLGYATTIDLEIVTYEELIKNADHALYEAKDKGRNLVYQYKKPI